MTKEPAKIVANATLISLAVAARHGEQALIASPRLRPIVPEDYSEGVREQAAWQAATAHAS